MRRMKKWMFVISVMILMVAIFTPYLQARAAQDPNGVFKDISNHWAKSEIESLEELKITNGFPDRTFKPQKSLSREEFVVFLTRMLGYSEKVKKPSFKDVPVKHWSSPNIEAAIKEKIIYVKDYPKGFGLRQPITREEIALMTARALKLDPEKDYKFPFKDVSKISLDKNMVAVAVKAGLVKGYPDKTFRPKAKSTRAEAAVMLIRFYDYALLTANPNVPRPNPPMLEKGMIKLNEAVVELSPKIVNSLIYISADETIFTFEGNDSRISSMKAGDIFVIPPSEKYPMGFAKKVKQTKRNGSQTTIMTADPMIQEVIKELDIQKAIDVSAQNLIPINVPEGVTLKSNKAPLLPGLYKSQANVSGDGFSFELADLKINYKDVTLALSGDVVFNKPKMIVDIENNWYKQKKFHAEFITETSLEVRASAESMISAGGSYTSESSSFFKGRTVKGGLTVPEWMRKKKSTQPLEKEFSIGEYFLPVYGPVGATLEAYLVVEADMTFGVEVKLIQGADLDFGVIIEGGKVKKINKVDKKDPKVILTGQGGIDAEAGMGFGTKVAIYKLDIGGLEAETGLYGAIYGKAIVGFGETEAEIDKSRFSGLVCYQSEWGPFIEIEATLDALELFGMKNAELELFDIRWQAQTGGNCEGEMLYASPEEVILSSGEERLIDLQYVEYDKTQMNLTELETKETNLNIKVLEGELKDVSLTPVKVTRNGRDFLQLRATAAKNARSKQHIQTELIYKKKGAKEVKKKVDIYVTQLQGIQASPGSLAIQQGAKQELSVYALYENPIGKEPLRQYITGNMAISYTSSHPLVEVTSLGEVTVNMAANAGETANITISYQGMATKVPVTILQRPIPPLTTDDIKAIILAAEEKAAAAFLPEAEKAEPASFETVAAKLEKVYTANYLNNYWKKVFDVNIKWFTDPHLLYPLTEAVKAGTESSFMIIYQHTNQEIAAKVSIPLRPHEGDGNFTYQYKLIKKAGVWQLDELTSE